MKQPDEQYSLATKVLHWVSALIIFVLIGVGLSLEDMADGPDKFRLIGLHKSFGVLLLLLLIIRIPVRLSNPVAPLPSYTRKDIVAAKALQGLLYLMMLIMPVSGILMSQSAGHPVAMFGLELPTLIGKSEGAHEFFEGVHGLSAWLLILLLAGHIGAALLHHFKLKDDTLKRMSFKK